MSKKTITIEVDSEFFKYMKKQKRTILVLQASTLIPQDQIAELEGTLNFMDHIQDKAIDELGFDKHKILDLPPDEDENPEGYKTHTQKFLKEVEKLNKTIRKNCKK